MPTPRKKVPVKKSRRSETPTLSISTPTLELPAISGRQQWIVLGLVCLLIVIFRLTLLSVPLERDEGEYAYAAQLILEGFPPFAQAYNMKMPGIYAAYALLIGILGQTTIAIRLGLLLINTATTVLFFLAFKRRLESWAAMLAAVAYALLSLNPSIHGFIANAEHFVLIFVAAGLLTLLKALDERRQTLMLLSGIFFGLAFLMKQHGVFFLGFAGLYLLFESRRGPQDWKFNTGSYLLFGLGALLPFVITCLIFWQTGVFSKFWFWTFTYAREYATMTTLAEGMRALKYNFLKMWPEFPLFIIWALIGLTVPWWNRSLRRQWLFYYGLTLFSFLAVTPGLYFRPHYFIFALPAIGLLAAAAMVAVSRKLTSAWSSGIQMAVLAIVAIVSCGYQFYGAGEVYFQMTPTQVARKLYWASPFPEAVEIARYIRDHSTEQDKVAIFGSEPEIFFYSRRKAASGYIYVYAMMEEHDFARRMQEEFMAEIKAANPKFVVLVNEPHSWNIRANSVSDVLKWGDQFIMDSYDLVGRIDILPPGDSRYIWGPQAAAAKHISRFWVDVYTRRP